MLIPVGSWWFVFRPQNMRNDEMRQQIEIKQAKLRQLNDAISTIGDLEKQIDELSKAIVFFKSKLPNEKEVDKILQEVWLLAKSNKLNPKSIRTIKRRMGAGAAPISTEHAEQPIKVELRGDFLGFYAFLMALENQPRITRIRKMTIKRLKDCKIGRISAEFEMSIFFERNGGTKT
jgi:type IV pilus assembly protein PilO